MDIVSANDAVLDARWAFEKMVREYIEQLANLGADTDYIRFAIDHMWHEAAFTAVKLGVEMEGCYLSDTLDQSAINRLRKAISTVTSA